MQNHDENRQAELRERVSEPWAGRKQARSVEGPSRREEGPGAAIMDDVAAAAHGKPRIVI